MCVNGKCVVLDLYCLATQMQYTARRGFYLVLPTLDEPQPSSSTSHSDITAGGLPHGYLKIDAGRARSGIPCTTHELTALNARLRDAADDCFALTEQVLWPYAQPSSHLGQWMPQTSAWL